MTPSGSIAQIHRHCRQGLRSGTDSAEEFGLGDGVLFFAEHILFVQLVELAELVRERVAALVLEWKGDVGRDDELRVVRLDFEGLRSACVVSCRLLLLIGRVDRQEAGSLSPGLPSGERLRAPILASQRIHSALGTLLGLGHGSAVAEERLEGADRKQAEHSGIRHRSAS